MESRNPPLIYSKNNYYILQSLIHLESQFDRCLDQLFGIVLNPEDDAKMMEKYGSPEPKRKGMVNYRHFCEVIGAGESHA